MNLYPKTQQAPPPMPTVKPPLDAYKPVNERTFSPLTKITGCTEHHDIEMKLCLLCELAIKAKNEEEFRAKIKELENRIEYLEIHNIRNYIT